jgi:ATP-dependent DNA helicase DinG
MLAYLLPAVLSGRRVVISTATKTLQEQIIFKDLPLLHEAASLELAVTVMKGRANYFAWPGSSASRPIPGSG